MAGEEESIGGYDFDIVGREVPDYRCSLCMMLLRKAVSLPCTHSACRTCLKSWQETQGGPEYQCPVQICKSNYIEESIDRKLEYIDRIITTQTHVKCPQNQAGCDWIGFIIDYEHHKKECRFKCRYDGCVKKDQENLISEHEVGCEYCIVECEFCKNPINYNALLQHNKICDCAPVSCPNKDCHTKVLRKELQKHKENNCLYEDVPCVFAGVGCTRIMEQQHRKAHLDETQHHLTLLMLETINNTKEIKQLKSKLCESEKILHAYREKNHVLEERRYAYEEKMREYEEKNRALEEKLYAYEETMREKVLTLEKKFADGERAVSGLFYKIEQNSHHLKDRLETEIEKFDEEIVKFDIEITNSRHDIQQLQNQETITHVDLQNVKEYFSSMLEIRDRKASKAAEDAEKCLLELKDLKVERLIHKDNKGYLEILRKLHSMDDRLVNEQDDDGSTALHFAAANNMVHIVAFLLDIPKIDVNKEDKEGYTADQMKSCNEMIRALIIQKRKINNPATWI